MDWVAEQFVVFVAPGGRRWRGRIAIGMPGQDDMAWGCRVVAEGVVVIPGPIFGESALQAMVLALRFLGGQLHHFIENGGRALEPHGESDARLDLTFGAMWCRP